ncbi:thioesterase II family protein [Solwaraspora sp. WMMB335]|uniref:thioesterase II family protein n=1 Tax=Solwaraspora sp. WMMB335 TaxID=3404118 RepID=UPI003B94214C
MTPFLRPRQAGDFTLRLVVFHHAGGSAAGYHPLARELPPDWDVLLADLPGRGRRYGEAPYRAMSGAVEEMVHHLSGHTDLPYALFGHSMGAVVATEVGRRMSSLAKVPIWVGVSGRSAPSTVDVHRQPLWELDDDRLLDVLFDLGGTPQRLRQMPGLQEQFVQLARADLQAVDSYRPAPERRPLSCPLTVLGGLADPWAPPATLADWQAETARPLRQCFFPGGHFYFLGVGVAALAREIRTEVSAALLDCDGVTTR